MVFSSITFLAFFLPCFLIIYFIMPNIKIKNLVLVLFSLFFYAWGEPIWVIALIFSGTIDYIHGLIINKYRNKWQSKGALISSLFLNFGLLFIVKYSNFLVDNINMIFNIHINIPYIALPIGISFYTFQTVSYTIDLYRDKTEYQKSYINFMAYVTMFPQLVAGPIVRYSDIAKQLKDREITYDRFNSGFTRFVIGLFKKTVFANYSGKVATLILTNHFVKESTLGVWFGIIMFGFQIYFDFSGYSDMAIGLGRIIGFDFKENFNYPYTSKSITDFWRRWHISLSSFFKDYVYIPLGGNKHNQIRNIFIVWGLTGLWHGASWNFILWGLYYGVILVIEKLFLKNFLDKLPNLLKHIYTLFLVIFGWFLFYFVNISQLYINFKYLIGIGVPAYNYETILILINNFIFIIILCIASTPMPKKIVLTKIVNLKYYSYINLVFTIILLITCFALILGQSYNPFLYFRF